MRAKRLMTDDGIPIPAAIGPEVGPTAPGRDGPHPVQTICWVLEVNFS